MGFAVRRPRQLADLRKEYDAIKASLARKEAEVETTKSSSSDLQVWRLYATELASVVAVTARAGLMSPRVIVCLCLNPCGSETVERSGACGRNPDTQSAGADG